jgi:thiol-disulfide isomerase/thioredoxin
VRRPAALAAAVLALGLLAACDDKPQGVTLGDEQPVAQSRTQVDTPELQALKARTAMVDCAPGPGGGQLPELTLPCLGGGTPVDLASLKGPMILSFWGSGCGPCREEMPALEAFWQQHGSQVPVLGVDLLDQFPATALQQVEKRGVTYPSVADPGGDVQGFPQFAKIIGMPMMVFVDADGKVAGTEFGGVDSADEVADKAEEYLGVTL